MRLGKIPLFCPVCGASIALHDDALPFRGYYMKQFGNLCSKDCYDWAQLAYARSILHKDSEPYVKKYNSSC